ncbi:hypothetical protein CROQUDRAFT_671156 [Cronartium quercuum f. sp. fusiforme G11]|uniref:Uncharacterized protein n=1 Tax=Cronartium quercuum f. sp. fusiforme G11 TaxID=708437 RepID=A0A9P6TD76_9BASI|nr:hypothetical protein CROQUDRAFT_671156 [Cronartium quercuum f. sp. fusiforme G11]
MFSEEFGSRLNSSSVTFRENLIARLNDLSSSIPSLVEKALPIVDHGARSARPMTPQVFIEPRVLSDVSVSGEPIHLRSFIHIIKDVLLANPHAYHSGSG